MRHKYSDALVSFAGPFANLFLCVVFITICGLAEYFIQDKIIVKRLFMFFGIGAVLNLVLFVFNMFPIPSFDGWHVFCHFFPRLEHAVGSSEFNKGATIVLMIILFTSIDKIFYYANVVVLHGINFVTKLLALF